MRVWFALVAVFAGCATTQQEISTHESEAHLPSAALVGLPRLADDLDLDYLGEGDGYIELSAPPDHVMLVRDSRRALVNGHEISMDDPCMWRGEGYVLTAGDAARLSQVLERLRSERRANEPAPVVRASPARDHLSLPAAWRPAPGVRNRQWRFIVIHHTATPAGAALSIHRMHRRRGFDGLGYHFVIGNGTATPVGEVEVGFRWKKQLHGAHARARTGDDNRWNRYGIGICLVGNFEKQRVAGRQLDALVRLVRTLQDEYGIPAANVHPHRFIKSTACPGRNFPWNEFKARLR